MNRMFALSTFILAAFACNFSIKSFTVFVNSPQSSSHLFTYFILVWCKDICSNRTKKKTISCVLNVHCIFWQVFSGVLNLSMSLMRDCRLQSRKFNKSANIINFLRSFLAFFIVFSNVMVSAFDPTIRPDPFSNLEV